VKSFLSLTARRLLLDQTGVNGAIGEAHGEVVLTFQPLNPSPVNLNVLQCVAGFEVEDATFYSLDLPGDVIPVFEDDPIILSLRQEG
jgi:hypothetical protein